MKKEYKTIDYPYSTGENPQGKEAVLSIRNLHVSFDTDEGKVRAVRGVSFDLYQGETLCIVGESGSGKSVTSKTIMGILGASAHIDQGSITYEGEDLTKISEEEFHKIRGTKIGMIFQDPLSSLNPLMRIGKQITEVMIINGNKVKKLRDDIINETLIKLKNDQRLLSLAKEEIRFSRHKKTKTNDEKLAKKKEVEEKKATYKKEKERLKPIIKEDRKALRGMKKVAHAKCAEFKKEKRLEHWAKQKVLVKDLFKNLFKPQAISKFLLVISERRRYISELKVTRKDAKAKALKIMQEVGISEPERRFRQYPFEFSGGMRQRIVIAIALTANPNILICDEPTTALDVTIQAQILELINRLKKARNMSVIFITHDLGVVANMADRVAVMYAGKIVEYGTSEDVFYNPVHPYTWALLSSIPDIDSKERLEAIPGTPPNMLFPPKGDAFALRSKYAMGIDFKEEPPMFEVSPTHYAATWLLDKRAPEAKMPKIVETRIKNSLKKKGVTR